MTNQLRNKDTLQKEGRDHVCLALDIHDFEKIMDIVKETKDLVGYYKLNSAFVLHGPDLVRNILNIGGKVFLDLKICDIPNTLLNYGIVIASMRVSLATIHMSGGVEMMKHFIEGLNIGSLRENLPRPKVLGITLLTSIDQEVLNSEVGIPGRVDEEILRKMTLAYRVGLDGIVCSASDLPHLRRHETVKFMYVTPGVRPSPDFNDSQERDDQKRVATYSGAIEAGSDLLVVGRPILNAKDPREALLQLHEEIGPYV
ncbi:MAG TPA: orotidine-5'-phosphate decarboxylase [Anaerolineales bacterium]|nr:orotidine-5'-phosphate decarboxylase [Anaerolineales bacterium]